MENSRREGMKLITKYLSDDKLMEFYEPGKDWYGFDDYTKEFNSEEDFVQATGILGFEYYEPYWEDELPYLWVYDKNSDLEMYLNKILQKTEEDFKIEYGMYSVVMRKYNIIKQLLIDGGFLN